MEQAPGAGWVGAGLLGSVLAWLLFKHLPAKDAQIDAIIARHLAAEKEQRADFKEALNSLIKAMEGRQK